MIQLSKAKLRQELVVWQQRRDEHHSWSDYEAVGRLLYWLGEPDYSEHLRYAAHTYLGTDSSAYTLLTAGNLVRLAEIFSKRRYYGPNRMRRTSSWYQP